MNKLSLSILVVALLAGVQPAASAAVLAVTVQGTTHQFTSAQLLVRSDAATIDLGHDPVYGRTMRYRAVPLRALLSAFGRDASDTIEVRSTDGFVAQLPVALIQGKAEPWIAIEDAAHPWPSLPKKPVSAGPFYLVWKNPDHVVISSEQWPYAIAALKAVASPAQRWPAIAVSAAVPAGSALRRGQAVFVANCLTCHQLNGSGEGTMGPDLLRPMPASSYLTDAGLRALIRNPAAVRTWPQQQMPAFTATAIGNADVDATVAYLRYLATRRGRDPSTLAALNTGPH